MRPMNDREPMSGASVTSRARWETVAAEAKTLTGGPASTIGRPIPSQGHETSGVPQEPGLEFRDVLGEGGMGIVRLALQRTMGRTVAVKTLRPALQDPAATHKLLQEAWTTGRLEHPNIVPVYDIAVQADGSPAVVLKRIEGESWASLLDDPPRAAELIDGSDSLDRHLRILIQVCRAVHFAHSRGIVHLDIKPENVMIGLHGEVYLVDWGIAMALDDDQSGQLPLTSEHRGIVGTPHYLAPEMLDGDGRALETRTDVYLLGATLFELLAGHPPHGGESVMQVLHAALFEEPALPEEAPAELAAICRTALAREPTDRFRSAEAMRLALQAFLRHRESSRIAGRAALRLVDLERAGSLPSGLQRTHQAAFSEARFGFEQALASWPDNREARSGLARAFELMIELELEHGDPQVGAALAREAPELPSSLRRRIERAVARRQASLDELATRRADQDLRIGQRTRMFVFALLGLFWTVLPGLAHFARTRIDTTGHLFNVLVPLASMVLLGALAYWARESLSRTRVNRVAVMALFVGLTGQLALAVAVAVAASPPEQAIAGLLLIWAVVAAMLTLTVEQRAAPVPVLYLIGFFAASLWPEARYLVVASCNLVFVGFVGVLWRPERFRGPIALPDHRD